MIKFIIRLLIILVFIFLLFLTYLDYRAQHSPYQAEFNKGTVPTVAFFPNGKYQGTIWGLETPWKGKNFDQSQQTGTNLVQTGSTVEEKYPFKTYADFDLKNKDLAVIKIDYNVPGNPFWIKMVSDEIVMQQNNHYLGKTNLKVFPGLSFTLGYFELSKSFNSNFP